MESKMQKRNRVMSCKYCKELKSTGETEPLVVHHAGGKTYIKHKRKHGLAMLYHQRADGREACVTIDFCPICGENLRPFGQAWAHHL